MKTYVLTVSRYFPTNHKRKGEHTFFIEKINETLIPVTQCPILSPKIHTIRSNYELWAKRIKEVQEGKAILSIRYWSGKPYNSKQVEICQLDKNTGCGVQKLEFMFGKFNDPSVATTIFEKFDGNRLLSDEQLAKNDGLALEDFKEWFKKYDLSKKMAIIHFTSFRY